MSALRIFVVLLLLASVAACDPGADMLQPSPQLLEPLFAKGGESPAEIACPAADVVVHDEIGLKVAIYTAAPGTVIAVEGTVALSETLYIESAGITVTCASPGSGLTAPFGVTPALIYAIAPDVTLTGLVLDAAEVPYAVRSLTNANWNSDGLRIADNEVECGYSACIFLTGTAGAVIEDNLVTGSGQGSGIHLQGVGPQPDGSRLYPIDGAVVRGNVVHNTAASPISSGFGGIRVRDGKHVEVTGNTVTGPWSNSLSPDEITDSEVSDNVLEGALAYGIRISFNPFVVIATPDNRFQRNRISDTGYGGILVERACGNLFLSNDVRRAGSQPEVYFAVNTGGNAWMGNHRYVLDEGAFDCDGDGGLDPNAITGPMMKGGGKILRQIIPEVQQGGGPLARALN